MNPKSLAKLEFDKILSMLQDCCTSTYGQEQVSELKPSTNLAEILAWQRETSEAKDLLRREPQVPLRGIREIRSAVWKAKMGGVLEPAELLDVASTVMAIRQLRGFLTRQAGQDTILWQMGNSLGVFPSLEKQITDCITDDATVKDTASPALNRLRHQIRGLESRGREKLEQIIRQPEYQKLLQEAIVTIRGDRYVVPVKQEYRAQFAGIVHDQSASGATLFIEPMAVVEINNELRRVRLQEQEEVTRILRELTSLIRVEAAALEETIKNLGRIDFVLAKGKLSQNMDAGEPKLNAHGCLAIIQGRHPLIGRQAVPVTVCLGKDFDILVITGPNTGGKTVTLKTIGLLTLMAQAGLHVPAQTGTELSVFEQVWVDIGDEQSIEQSLSTFSSHMSNIVQILRSADQRSLILLDELGAGTDPTEGSALAMAILEHLQNVGAKVVATTHYSELKTFAYSRERVENASVEFDVRTLRPTYRLLIGLPGRSNAFEIASRLGLAPEIVNRAKQFISGEELQVADLIQNLKENQRVIEQEREEAERLRSEATRIAQELQDKRQEWKERETRLLQKAQAEAFQIIRQARQEADQILRELRRVRTQAAEKAAVRTAEEAKKRLKSLQDQVYEQTQTELAETTPNLTELKPGDLVEIIKLQQRGYVLSEPNSSGEVQVQAGIMKINVKLAELKKVKEKKETRDYAGIGQLMANKTKTIANELDCRGLTVEEAIIQVDKYLDDAYLAGLLQVYLIHGKGTGALRAAIKEYLATHPYVRSQRAGAPYEGGLGVTVVQLKNK